MASGRIRTDHQSRIALVNGLVGLTATDDLFASFLAMGQVKKNRWRLAHTNPHEDASLNVQAIKNDSPWHEDPHSPCLCVEWALASKTRSTIVPNTAIVFTKCEEAIGTMTSMALRHAFRIRRPLPFPAGCFRQNGHDLQLGRMKGGSSKRVFLSHLSVDDEGTVTMNGVSKEIPWGRQTTCSWKLHHDCSRRASL